MLVIALWLSGTQVAFLKLYFDPYSETSILESIKEVIYDDRKRTELIMRGRERLKLYSWEKATALTQKTYLKALNME